MNRPARRAARGPEPRHPSRTEASTRSVAALPAKTAWTGPFQPVLEAAWLDALRAVRARDPLGAVWLLVPSRFLGLHLARLAARAGGAVNVHVLTFTDLADRLLASATRPLRRLPEVGDVLVLRQALRAVVRDDGYFAAVREARRFPALLAATLAELRTAGVAPDDLEAAAAKAVTVAGAAKLREVAQIARHAAELLGAGGFTHPTDALWAAAERAPRAPALEGCAALLVYGFVDWNAAERALLARLVARLPGVCFVPAEPGPAFAPLEPLLAWLADQGFTIEPPPTAPPPRGPRALAARLFHEAGTAPPAPDPVTGLEVIAAPGEEREVREIARRILAAAAEGIPFDAMGILVRRPDDYRSAIRDVFAVAGIPYTWGVAPRLGETRAGRSLRLLLLARRDGFGRAAVMEFLATAELRAGEGVEPAEWDRLSREAGIVAGREDWRRGLGRLRHRLATAPPPADDEDRVAPPPPDATAVDALGRIVGTLLDALATLSDPAPAATLARGLLRAFLRLCRRDHDVEQVAAGLAGFEALAPLAEPISLDEFADLVDVALALPAEPGPEARQGKVFVGELHQALGLPFRFVVIPGLVEQGFPAAPRPDPILAEDERATLDAQVPGGRPGLGAAARRPAEERLAFRLAVAAAEERLLLTYPRVEVPSGRPRVPSFFLLRLAEAATGRPFDFSRLETEWPAFRRVALAPAPREAIAAPIDEREWLLAQASRGREGGARGRAACLALSPRAARGRVVLEAREHGLVVSPWDGLLPAELRPALARHHRPAEAPVAATPLETYATCPFRYYLAHVLGLAPAREPERLLTLPPADRGRLLHTVLARAYAAFRDGGLLPLTPERLPEARPIVERAFDEAEAALGALGLAPFWQGERARLRADVLAALEAEARATADGVGWVPSEFELAFGAGPEPGVEHRLASGRVLGFRGRLDRLDVSADGTRARVIDYKSGRARGAAGKLAGGTALQLPIYRLAAEAICEARGLGARVERAEYYFLTRRGGRRHVPFGLEDWQARRADFDRALEAVLDGIAAGRFFQEPSAESCRACDYPVACGPERERIAWVEQKRADPVREPFARLREIQ